MKLHIFQSKETVGHAPAICLIAVDTEDQSWKVQGLCESLALSHSPGISAAKFMPFFGLS
jgi:hypothetical protein